MVTSAQSCLVVRGSLLPIADPVEVQQMLGEYLDQHGKQIGMSVPEPGTVHSLYEAFDQFILVTQQKEDPYLSVKVLPDTAARKWLSGITAS